MRARQPRRMKSETKDDPIQDMILIHSRQRNAMFIERYQGAKVWSERLRLREPLQDHGPRKIPPENPV